MVRPVEADARGIVTPDAGLRRFDLERFPPSKQVGRFVAWYWIVSWDLRGEPSHTQHVFAHPVVNVTFQDEPDGLVTGVTTRMSSQTISGQGRALGVMFRPAGFRPVLGRPLAEITDARLGLSEVVGSAQVASDLAAAVLAAAPDHAAMAAAADTGLAALLPDDKQPSEDTTVLVERVAAEPAFVRVEDLAVEAGSTTRQLQRLFADHVGLGPKAVIRRYRLYEAAERARHGETVDWATVAAELGYSDQAHLSRAFTASFGLPPGRYLRANNPDDPA